MRFRVPLGAGFSEKYHVSPLSILWHCFYVVSNAPKWLQDCMLSVALILHTNEQVQWPGGKYVNLKYLISDYKPAPLPFLPMTRYILFISFFDQIGYILVIGTKFLFFCDLWPHIFALYFFVYISFWQYKVYIGNQY